MKKTESNHNPLGEILELLPSEFQFLTTDQFNSIRSKLLEGGIHCEAEEEVISALSVLTSLGAIEIIKTDDTYLIKKNYG